MQRIKQMGLIWNEVVDTGRRCSRLFLFYWTYKGVLFNALEHEKICHIVFDSFTERKCP